MQGIEIAKSFYELSVKPMIERDFADISDRVAMGLVGHGSECFGFDDIISTDHDFEPSLCIWLDDEDEKNYGFKLSRAYSKLQKQFCENIRIQNSLAPQDFRGVMTISDFYRRYTGRSGAPETLEDWIYIPSSYLAEATNGVVFCDNLGKFTSIREQIKYGMPEDARLKKIASCAFYMAQSGQYNFKRCLQHGEISASRLALAEFVKNSIEIVFLLNSAYMPYYKWSFKAMRTLEIMGNSAPILDDIINIPSERFDVAFEKTEQFCALVIEELKRQNITDSSSDYLENHAYSINAKIKDNKLRNLPIML